MRQFLIYSNIHIPFLAACLLFSTGVLLHVPLSWPLAVVACAGAFLIYQLDRIWFYSPEDVINQPERVQWSNKHRGVNGTLSLLAILAALIAVYWLDRDTVLICIGTGGLGLLYLIPHGREAFRLKSIWFGKPLLITVCWGFGSVILPVLESEKNLNAEVWLFFAYRSFLVLSNVLLADLPDRKGDSATNLNTMSVMFPRQVMTSLAMFFAAVALLIGLYHSISFLWAPVLYTDLIGALIMLLLAIRAHKALSIESHFVYGFVVDLIIAWPIIGVLLYYVL